jgi:hypothetical protein
LEKIKQTVVCFSPKFPGVTFSAGNYFLVGAITRPDEKSTRHKLSQLLVFSERI